VQAQEAAAHQPGGLQDQLQQLSLACSRPPHIAAAAGQEDANRCGASGPTAPASSGDKMGGRRHASPGPPSTVAALHVHMVQLNSQMWFTRYYWLGCRPYSHK
jgi:hypothetical protein